MHSAITEHADMFLQMCFKITSDHKDFIIVTEKCLKVGKIPSSWIAPKTWPKFLSFIRFYMVKPDWVLWKAYHTNQWKSVFDPGITHWSYRLDLLYLLVGLVKRKYQICLFIKRRCLRASLKCQENIAKMLATFFFFHNEKISIHNQTP